MLFISVSTQSTFERAHARLPLQCNFAGLTYMKKLQADMAAPEYSQGWKGLKILLDCSHYKKKKQLHSKDTWVEKQQKRHFILTLISVDGMLWRTSNFTFFV